MSHFQIGFLIFAGVAFVAIILIGIYVKPQKRAREADIQFDIPAPATSAEDNSSYATISEEQLLAIVADPLVMQEWYVKAARKHRKRLQKINWWIGFYLVLQGVLLLIGLLAMLVFSSSDGEGSAGGFLFILLLGGGLYFWLLSYYLTNRNKNVVDAISSNKYVGLSNNQFPAIWALCDSLMAKMGLQEHYLQIFYVKSNNVEASVLVENDSIYLLLSRGLITYSRQNPKDVESILGHEFGHVYQGDTKMLLVNKRMVRVPALIQGVGLGITLLMVILAGLAGDTQGISFSGMNILWISYFFQLGILRKEAEYLADMASVAFVSDSSLPVLIRKYMPNKETSTYPSSKNRVYYIENTVKNLASKGQTKLASGS